MALDCLRAYNKAVDVNVPLFRDCKKSERKLKIMLALSLYVSDYQKWGNEPWPLEGHGAKGLYY